MTKLRGKSNQINKDHFSSHFIGPRDLYGETNYKDRDLKTLFGTCSCIGKVL